MENITFYTVKVNSKWVVFSPSAQINTDDPELQKWSFDHMPVNTGSLIKTASTLHELELPRGADGEPLPDVRPMAYWVAFGMTHLSRVTGPDFSIQCQGGPMQRSQVESLPLPVLSAFVGLADGQGELVAGDFDIIKKYKAAQTNDNDNSNSAATEQSNSGSPGSKGGANSQDAAVTPT